MKKDNTKTFYTCVIESEYLRKMYYELLSDLGYTPTPGIKYNTIPSISIGHDFFCNNFVNGAYIVEDPRDFLEIAIKHSVFYHL